MISKCFKMKNKMNRCPLDLAQRLLLVTSVSTVSVP